MPVQCLYVCFLFLSIGTEVGQVYRKQADERTISTGSILLNKEQMSQGFDAVGQALLG